MCFGLPAFLMIVKKKPRLIRLLFSRMLTHACTGQYLYVIANVYLQEKMALSSFRKMISTFVLCVLLCQFGRCMENKVNCFTLNFFFIS